VKEHVLMAIGVILYQVAGLGPKGHVATVGRERGAV
jgi:hypothetical protein